MSYLMKSKTCRKLIKNIFYLIFKIIEKLRIIFNFIIIELIPLVGIRVMTFFFLKTNLIKKMNDLKNKFKIFF